MVFYKTVNHCLLASFSVLQLSEPKQHELATKPSENLHGSKIIKTESSGLVLRSSTNYAPTPHVQPTVARDAVSRVPVVTDAPVRPDRVAAVPV